VIPHDTTSHLYLSFVLYQHFTIVSCALYFISLNVWHGIALKNFETSRQFLYFINLVRPAPFNLEAEHAEDLFRLFLFALCVSREAGEREREEKMMPGNFLSRRQRRKLINKIFANDAIRFNKVFTTSITPQFSFYFQRNFAFSHL
jgi:hypothetical protein